MKRAHFFSLILASLISYIASAVRALGDALSAPLAHLGVVWRETYQPSTNDVLAFRAAAAPEPGRWHAFKSFMSRARLHRLFAGDGFAAVPS